MEVLCKVGSVVKRNIRVNELKTWGGGNSFVEDAEGERNNIK